MVNGNKTTYAQVPQYIATNIWYYIRIVVTGARAQCYLGTNAAQAATNLVQDVTLPAVSGGGFLASTTYASAAGQIIVKAVNRLQHAGGHDIQCRRRQFHLAKCHGHPIDFGQFGG